MQRERKIPLLSLIIAAVVFSVVVPEPEVLIIAILIVILCGVLFIRFARFIESIDAGAGMEP